MVSAESYNVAMAVCELMNMALISSLMSEVFALLRVSTHKSVKPVGAHNWLTAFLLGEIFMARLTSAGILLLVIAIMTEMPTLTMRRRENADTNILIIFILFYFILMFYFILSNFRFYSFILSPENKPSGPETERETKKDTRLCPT